MHSGKHIIYAAEMNTWLTMLFVVYEICANAISAQNVFMVPKCDIAQYNTATAAMTMAVAWLSDGNPSSGFNSLNFILLKRVTIFHMRPLFLICASA